MCEGAPVGWPHSEGRWRVPDLERPVSDVQAAGEGGEGVARLASEKELKGRVGEWEGTGRAREVGETQQIQREVGETGRGERDRDAQRGREGERE